MKDNEFLQELVRISCKYPDDTAYLIANFRDPFNWLAKGQLNQTKINKLIDTLKNEEDKNGKTTFEKSELLIFLGKNIEHAAKIVFYNMAYILDVVYINIALGADARSIEKTVLFEYGESSKEYVSFFFDSERMDPYHIADNNTTKTIYKQLEDNSIKSESVISDVTFEDVAGIESVKAEVAQLVDFLKNPEKYNKLGAKIPKGILFTGLPGTGKTLMAKAVAGEAGVHFMAESGAKFVQKYVGAGAREIEKMFKNARKFDSCILFIDEIDAFTQIRDSESKGDDTINQFLTELDGFNSTDDRILIIGATNRVELMDPAVLRPGRFDRKVHFDLPDINGREAILKIHGKNKPFDSDVDFKIIAGKTIGMSGADLENLLNEAAILGATRNADCITMEDIEKSSEKIIMGLAKEKKVTEEEKLMVAVHETGHAVAMHILDTGNDLHSLTIIPRGNALGYARAINTVEKGYKTKDEYLNGIMVSLAGVVAEDTFIGEKTSACSSDLKKASTIATLMVTSYGMEDSLFVEDEISEDSKKEIDIILRKCYRDVKILLEKYRKEIFKIINELLAKETLYQEDIIKILGKDCKDENTYKEKINILKGKLAKV